MVQKWRKHTFVGKNILFFTFKRYHRYCLHYVNTLNVTVSFI